MVINTYGLGLEVHLNFSTPVKKHFLENKASCDRLTTKHSAIQIR